MNLRTFATISAVAMLVLGGCVIVGDPDNTGGAAGSGGSSTDTSSSSGVAGAGGSVGGNGGGGAGGGAAACAEKCSETVTDNTLTPCATASDTTKKLFEELAACVCGDMGACQATCKPTSYCGGADGMGTQTYTDCQKCLQDNTATGCGAQVNACAAD